MDEGLQELKAEKELIPADQMPEAVMEEVALEIPAEMATFSQNMNSGWLRLAYMFEFLLALNVVYTLWSEVGGQGHLDLMPWYTKLICGVGLSWSVVRFTAGIAEMEKFWNWRTRRWFIIILFFVVAMGGIVYYYHLHEAPDESDSEDAAATSVQLSHPDKPSRQI